MATVIDADTHVIESERVWDFFDEELAHRKPQLVPCADPNTGNVRNFWIIDSKLIPHPPGKGGQALATPPVDDEIRGSTAWRKRAMTDVDARLDDATDMGVDVQVVYPTLFIGFLTHDVELEVALARSYNRFMADACSRSGGRIRWVAVPPLRDLDKTMEELHFGKENGACGVLFRGVEKDRSLAEPYFFPVYEEAQRLDLPICIHTGPGSPMLTEFFDSRLSFVFPDVRLLPVMAFYDLACSKVPERFPDLRWGFIEANSSWVPYLAHFLHRRLRGRTRGVRAGILPREPAVRGVRGGRGPAVHPPAPRRGQHDHRLGLRPRRPVRGAGAGPAAARTGGRAAVGAGEGPLRQPRPPVWALGASRPSLADTLSVRRGLRHGAD